MEDIVSELAVLEKVRGRPEFVQCFDVLRDKESTFVVFERLAFDLETVLFPHSRSKGSEPSGSVPSVPSEGLVPVQIRRLTWAVAAGLEFLHAQGIMHTDLKPANILVGSRDLECRFAIADLGNVSQATA